MLPKKSRHNTDMPPPTPDSENCFNNIMVIWKTIPPLWGLKPRGLDSPLFTLLIFLFSSSPNSTFPQFLLCMFPPVYQPLILLVVLSCSGFSFSSESPSSRPSFSPFSLSSCHLSSIPVYSSSCSSYASSFPLFLQFFCIPSTSSTF